MNNLISEIKNCTTCASSLTYGVNPVLSAHKESKIAIIGQAPGSIVHQSGVPWDDMSGERLREWLNLEKNQFYNTKLTALIPMSFCYPGKGKSGDLPPRKECAPQWHNLLFSKMDRLQIILLIGSYSQAYYLGSKNKKNLTSTVKSFKEYLPDFFVLTHPSPRNNIWLKRNPWFDQELLPELKQIIKTVIK